MDIQTLRSEIENDPETLGYSGKTDKQIRDILNTKDREVDVESVTGQELFEAVKPSDYDNLTDKQAGLLHAIISMGTILVNGENTKAALLAMFGAGTDTRTNLAALQTKTISRATELGLSNVREGTIQAIK